MQTEEEFLAEFEQAHNKYIALRAAAGFPFKKPDPNAPLPSWVLRNGERPKLTFVTRSPAPVQTKTDSVLEYAKTNNIKINVIKVPLVKPTGDKPKSKAETVRDMIRAAMAAGKTIDDVIAQARAELGMGNAQAKTYVTENWTRVSKG